MMSTKRTHRRTHKPIAIQPIYAGSFDSDSDEHACESDEKMAQHSMAMHCDSNEALKRYRITRKRASSCKSAPVVYDAKLLHKCHILPAGSKVIVKQINCSEPTKLLKELRVLRLLRGHKNILRLHDIVPPKQPQSHSSLFIVHDFFGFNLDTIFRTNQHFTKLQVQYILGQIISALNYMHSAHIAHGNLTPQSISINTNCDIIITDFSSATSFDVNCHTICSEKEDEKAPESRQSVADKKKKKRVLQRSRRRPLNLRCGEPPECLLKQSKPSTLHKSDMWRVGVIFAELMQMQRAVREYPSERGPLFEYNSCFTPTVEGTKEYQRRMDELNYIFDVIGTPDRKQIAKINDSKTRKDVLAFPEHKGKNLQRVLRGADEHALDLLRKLVLFDADERVDAAQALKHTYLKPVRDNIDRKRMATPITIRFEMGDLGHRKMREMILEEAAKCNECQQRERVLLVDGYFRICCQSPRTKHESVVPLHLVHMCCAYLF